jgi:hypothetical protein
LSVGSGALRAAEQNRWDFSKPSMQLPTGSTVARSLVSHARDRVGNEPVRWLFERSASVWSARSAEAHEWRGLLPPRRGRTFPRAVKIKMSSYDRKRPEAQRSEPPRSPEHFRGIWVRGDFALARAQKLKSNFELQVRISLREAPMTTERPRYRAHRRWLCARGRFGPRTTCSSWFRLASPSFVRRGAPPKWSSAANELPAGRTRARATPHLAFFLVSYPNGICG